MFTIYSDSGSDSTMVSNLFIDEYMERANDAQIKVYLYLLRVMGSHRATSVSDLADRFNHTEKDVVRSLRYWEKQGLLNLTFGKEDDLVSICLCRPCGPAVQNASAEADARQDRRVLSFPPSSEEAGKAFLETSSVLPMAAGGSLAPQPGHRMASGRILSETAGGEDGFRLAGSSLPDTAPAGGHGENGQDQADEKEALESFCSDAERAQLLFVIEQYVGKPLSLNEVRIIHHISSRLAFTDDMIDYLVQYCVDRGKKDFHYIRKVADNWAEKGIMTPAQAEAWSSALDRKKEPEKSAPAARSFSGDGDSRSASGQPGKKAGRSRSSNSFNQFEQNSYDFDALEEELLASAK